MGKVRILQLSAGQKMALQQGFRNGKSHGFRRRCQVVLLSSEGRSCKEVGSILGMNQVSVSHWLNRYEREGIDGLLTKPGRGRKPLRKKEQDDTRIRETPEQERQTMK
jgi:transposase